MWNTQLSSIVHILAIVVSTIGAFLALFGDFIDAKGSGISTTDVAAFALTLGFAFATAGMHTSTCGFCGAVVTFEIDQRVHISFSAKIIITWPVAHWKAFPIKAAREGKPAVLQRHGHSCKAKKDLSLRDWILLNGYADAKGSSRRLDYLFHAESMTTANKLR